MLKRSMLLLLLAFLVMSQTVQAASYKCLKLDNRLGNSALLNWQTGAVRKLSLPYTDDANYENYVEMNFSPSGQYVVYMRPDPVNSGNDDNSGVLIVAPVNTVGELGSETVVRSGLGIPVLSAEGWQTTATEYYWSQDSRWLLYRWTDRTSDPPGQYLAIATPDGKTLRTITLPSFDSVLIDHAVPTVNVIGPIGGPNVVLTFASDPNSGRPYKVQIAFLRIPDLTWHYAFASDKEFAGNLCLGTGYGPTCSVWSPDGRRMAIGRLDRDGKTYLVIFGPDFSKPYAVFPVAAGRTAIWSPDGQYIAVYSIVNPGDPNSDLPDTSRASIEILGVDSGSHITVTENALIWHGGDVVSVFVTPMQWCDSRHLVYQARIVPDNNQNIRTEDFSIPVGQAINISLSVNITSLYDSDKLAMQIVTPDCKSIYDLQQWSQGNTDYVGVANASKNIRTTLTDHKVTDMKWIGTTALAWWHGGLAWMNADGTNRHEIAVDADVTPQDTSADGQWLLFIAAPNTPADLYIANLKSGAYRLLLANATKWAFSPHDRYILATNGKSAGTYLVALPDGQPHAVDLGSSAASEAVYRVEWSPDGMIFAVFASDQNASTLDVFQPNGTHIRNFDNVPSFNTLSWPLMCGT